MTTASPGPAADSAGLISIVNDGPLIASTNYWESDHAMGGLCYLSANAGTWRLLVPDMAESMLPEMRTGKRVNIERSLHDSRCWDVVFEDGTDSPFSVAIDKRQTDRAMVSGRCQLSVWTRLGGLVLQLPCSVKVTP